MQLDLTHLNFLVKVRCFFWLIFDLCYKWVQFFIICNVSNELIRQLLKLQIHFNFLLKMYLLKQYVSLCVSFETCGAYEGKVESGNAKCIRKVRVLLFSLTIGTYNVSLFATEVQLIQAFLLITFLIVVNTTCIICVSYECV